MAMNVIGLLLGAVLTVQPLANEDFLEPSILNEVDHAIAKAPRHSCASFVLPFVTNGLTRSAMAIKLVSAQRPDGRWYLGTNDVTFAALHLLENLARAERPNPPRRLMVGVTEYVRTNTLRQVSVHSFYCEALARAGHSSVVIPAVSDTSVYESLIASLDAIIITGGEDINPARYRATVSPRCGKPNLGRDNYDWAVLTEAVRQRKPLLGICRGVQFMNVFFGGTLYQDIPSELPQSLGAGHCIGNYNKMWITPSAHTNIIVKGTRLANVLGEAPLLVNSLHHQAVKDIAPGFRVAARATDGIVEAIEGIDYPAVGLQFHPEAIFGEDRVHPDYDYDRLGIIFKDLMKLLTGKGNQE